MPANKSVNEPKLLQLCMMLGWGCLIYNHREHNLLLSHGWEHQPSYKKLLSCIGELFFAVGLHDDFYNIKNIFLNYDNDPQLQQKVSCLFEGLLERYQTSRINEWYDYFLVFKISADALNLINKFKKANFIGAIAANVQVFDEILGLNKKYAKPFNHFMSCYDASVFFDFDSLWKPALTFLIEGYKYFPSPIPYSLLAGKLCIDFSMLANNLPVDYAELQEDLVGVKSLTYLEFKNCNFSCKNREVFFELKKILQGVKTIIRFNVYLGSNAQAIFDAILEAATIEVMEFKLHNKVPFKLEDWLRVNLPPQALLVSFIILQAEIESMHQVQQHNFQQNFWNPFLKIYKPAIKKNWLQDFTRNLQCYSNSLLLEHNAWQGLREQVLHGSALLAGYQIGVADVPSRSILLQDSDTQTHTKKVSARKTKSCLAPL